MSLTFLFGWMLLAVLYWAVAVGATVGLRLPEDDRSNEGSQRAAAGSDELDGPTTLLLRPLHGAAEYVRPCLESLWTAAGEFGAAIRIGIENADDPAVAIAMAVASRCPSVDARIVYGEAPGGDNHKVANLIQALGNARSDVVVLSDADILVPVDYVGSVIRPLEDPRVGLTTCPYRSVPSHSLTSRIDALLTNTRFLPSTCLAVRSESLHFSLGATIAVRTEALAAAGGLEALLNEPADDYALARNVERAGYRLAWVPLLLEHRLADEPGARAVKRQLRWTRAIREARPLGYLGLLIGHGMVPAVWLSVGWGGTEVPAARWILVGWWGYQAALLWLRRRLLGVRAGDLLLLPIADVVALLLYVAGWTGTARPPD